MEEMDNNSLENQALQLTLLDFLFELEDEEFISKLDGKSDD